MFNFLESQAKIKNKKQLCAMKGNMAIFLPWWRSSYSKMQNVYYGKEEDNVQSPVAACCISVDSGCLHGQRALLRKAYLERIAVILRHGEAYGKHAYVSRECLSLRLTWFMCTSLNIRPLGTIHTLVDNCRFCSYAPWGPSILFSKSDFLEVWNIWLRTLSGKNILGFIFAVRQIIGWASK